MRVLSLLFTFLLINNYCFAQILYKKKLDSYFDILNRIQKFMGSIIILKDGSPIYEKHVGYEHISSKLKSSNKTKYKIGSISKVCTASLIFKIIQEKKVTLNQTIHKFFPNVKNAKRITIANLLGHRSGINNFIDDKEKYISYYLYPKSKSEMLDIISNGGSDFKPNVKAVIEI